MKFCVEVEPPDASKILDEEILGIAALIITVSYRNDEFFRIGYFVNN